MLFVYDMQFIQEMVSNNALKPDSFRALCNEHFTIKHHKPFSIPIVSNDHKTHHYPLLSVISVRLGLCKFCD